MKRYKFYKITSLSLCVFSSIANAELSGVNCSGTNCTISTNQNGTITNNTQGNANLTINKGATLSGDVKNQGSLNINNSGEINNGAADSAISSDYQNTPIKLNIQNSGEISGGGGIEIGKVSTATQADISINNSGTIAGVGNFNIDQTVDTYGISIVGANNSQGNIKAEILNSGIITSKEYGINLKGNGSRVQVSKLENSGTISATDANGNDGIHIGATVSVESLKNIGQISGKYGVWMADDGRINSLENSGKIEGFDRGMALSGSASIESINNSGVIEGKGVGVNSAGIQIPQGTSVGSISVSGNGKILGKEGILLARDGGSGGELGRLEASGNATISSVANSGNINTITALGNANIDIIKNEANAKLQNINLSGSAKVGMLTNKGSVGSVSLANSAKIDSVVNEANSKLESLLIKDFAKVDKVENKGEIANLTTQGSGSLETLINDSGATISNLSLESDIKNFTNNGTIDKVETKTGNLDQFINSGNITTYINRSSIKGLNNTQDLREFDNFGQINGAITNSGTITRLNNAGTISGGIKNTGDILEVSNTGIVGVNADGRHLENAAGKTLKIIKWYVPSKQHISLNTHNDLEQVLSDGDSRIVLGGDGASDIDFSQATLLIDAKHYDTNVYYDVGNTILTKNSPYSSTTLKPLEIIDVSNSGVFRVLYDATSGKFIIDPRVNLLSGSFFSDYLINYAQRRNISINNLLRIEEEKLRFLEAEKAHIFLIPYYARDSFDLNARVANADVDTSGILSGWHTLSEWGVFGGFVGYESGDGDINILDSNVYSGVSGDVSGFYGGLRYKAFLHRSESGELSLSNQVKANYKEADLKMGLEDKFYSDSTKVWDYALDSTLSYDYYLNSGILSANAGLYYDRLNIGNFSLDTKSKKRSENLYGSVLGAKYLRNFSDAAFSLELGWHSVFDNEIKTSYSNSSDSFKIPSSYFLLQSGLNFDISKNAYFALNYGALVANNGYSHLASLVFNLKW
ncbi:MAG: hypothetical protein PUB96_01585 [Helicobacteraceae bacterium]|nr:hypothetical protein [Helicobacteraceae bacterium]